MGDMPRKFLHVSRISGGWSFGVCFTHDSCLDETYLFINFFKWSISIGKLAYLKEIEEDDD